MANGTHNNAAGGRKRGWITIVALVLVVVFASAIASLRPKRIRITVDKPATEEITSVISTNGKIEPVHNFEAHAPISTTVQKIYFREGEKVRKGQLILQLDDSSARAEVARANAQLRAAQANRHFIEQGGTSEEVMNFKADLNKARAEYESASRNLQALERLQQKGAASPEEVSAARDRVTRAQSDLNLLQQKTGGRYSTQDRSRVTAEVDQARASLAAAQKVLDESNVRAPFDGTVYLVGVKEGAYVNAGDVLVQVADLSDIQVRAFVDEPEIGKLGLDQVVQISWEALPGRTWTGKVKTVPTNVVTHGSRMVGEVITSVDNTDGRLLPNTNVNVKVITAAHPNALTIPREALRDDGDKTVVYIVNGKHLQKRVVQTGVANLTRVEITKGIAQTDRIAIQSLSPSPLSDGVTVKIVENP